MRAVVSAVWLGLAAAFAVEEEVLFRAASVFAWKPLPARAAGG